MQDVRSIARGSLIASVLLAGGCSSVTTVHPLPGAGGAAESQRLEGVWLTGDSVIEVRFTEAGLGRFAGLDWSDDRFTLEQGELVLTAEGDGGFLSVRTQEDGTWDETYYFVRYRFTDGGDLVLWEPVPAAFAAAVDDGRLEGTVERGEHSTEVVITAAPDVLLAFLNDPEDRTLFDYPDPMILRRVTCPVGPG